MPAHEPAQEASGTIAPSTAAVATTKTTIATTKTTTRTITARTLTGPTARAPPTARSTASILLRHVILPLKRVAKVRRHREPE